MSFSFVSFVEEPKWGLKQVIKNKLLLFISKGSETQDKYKNQNIFPAYVDLCFFSSSVRDLLWRQFYSYFPSF